jgi:putative flippase GtrA
MKKSDVIIALVIGEIVALYFMNLLKELTGKVPFLSVVLWSLPVVFPALSILCLWIAYLIGKKFLFVYQLAKFILIGALATIFDLGTLSIFISLSAATAGFYYLFFKGISFVFATIAKYFADKFWAFEKKETTDLKKEFTQFFLVTFVGLIINIAAAYVVVSVIKPQFGITPETWANFGGIGAVLITFLWNFVGYKFIVFKK